MPMNRSLFAQFVLVAALVAGLSAPARAEALRCGRQQCAGGTTQEFAAQAARRPHITIYPRRAYPGRNAKRQCRAWLAQEYRVSGPVIVPRQRCWWE